MFFLGVFALGVSGLRAEEATFRILTSFYPIYVAALNVTEGISGVEVANLTSPHIGCLHDYQMTTADARKIAEADIFLVNGAGMEPFLSAVERQGMGGKIVRASEGISLLEDNAHVWLSFGGERRQVENIVEALAKASPEHAAAFKENAERYLSKITSLEDQSRVILRPFSEVPIIVFHGAFAYLAQDFGLDVVGVIESEPGSEPVAKKVAEAVKLVRERHVKALVAEDIEANHMAKIVSRETSIPLYELDPVASGPAAPAEARGTWLRAMEKNVSVLARALR